MRRNDRNDDARTTRPRADEPLDEVVESAAPPTRNAPTALAPRAACVWVAELHRFRFLAGPLLAAAFLFGATGASAADPEVAVRAEGYVGYTRLDLIGSLDGFEGGGSGSLALLFDEFYAQADLFGEATDFERVVAGLTLYRGTERPSLREYDRRFFQPSCAGIHLAERAC